MITTEKYDYNIWSNSDDVLYLTAYEQFYNAEGDINTDFSKFHNLTIPNIPENYLVIVWLTSFSDEGFMPDELTDYDNWVGSDDLTGEDVPNIIRNWVQLLPDFNL